MQLGSVRLGVGVAAILALIGVAGLGWRARARWDAGDYKPQASALVGRELQAERPGYRPVLTVRTYGRNATSRDLCVYELGGGGRILDIWSVQYTRGFFAPVAHEQYTPRWRPAHSGGIVRDLCLHSAAEPPPAGQS